MIRRMVVCAAHGLERGRIASQLRLGEQVRIRA
jgi:hypothetical protein